MNIKQVITDYIMKSILTTHGDLVVRGITMPTKITAVVVGQVLKSMGEGTKPAWGVPTIADMNMAVGYFTRSTGGNQVVTGLGFKPNLIFLLSVDSTAANMNWSLGITNMTLECCFGATLNGTEVNYLLNVATSIYRAAGNNLTGNVGVLGADGFTISFNLTGACSANINWFAIG